MIFRLIFVLIVLIFILKDIIVPIKYQKCYIISFAVNISNWDYFETVSHQNH